MRCGCSSRFRSLPVICVGVRTPALAAYSMASAIISITPLCAALMHKFTESHYPLIMETEETEAFIEVVDSKTRCLILLTTGRGRDLVTWELKNQAAHANVPLLSISSLYGGSSCSVKDCLVTCAARKKLNEVLFRAVFCCPEGCEPILKSVLSNCILLRSAYDQEVCSATGTDELWKSLFEMGLSSAVSSEPSLCNLICAVVITEYVFRSIASFVLRWSYYCASSFLNPQINVFYLINLTKCVDVNFIGRRIKAEKFIEQASSKLSLKSRKRKLADTDQEPTDNESKTNNERDEVSWKGVEDQSSERMSNIGDMKGNQLMKKNLHLLSDLRGLTNSDEKSAMYYAAELFCSGADSACQKFSKIYARKEKDLSSVFASDLLSARTSNSTTAMDFERCGNLHF